MTIKEYAKLLPNALSYGDGLMIWNIDDNTPFMPYSLQHDNRQFIVHIGVWKGSITVQTNMGTTSIISNQFATIIDCSQFAALNADSGTKATVLIFTSQFISHLLGNQPPIPVFFLVKARRNPVYPLQIASSHLLHQRMQQVWTSVANVNHAFHHKMIGCSIWMLLLDFSNLLMQSPGSNQQQSSKSPSNRRMQLFIQFTKMLPEQVKEHRCVEYYTSQLCVTPQYLNRIVKSISGRTAYAWICFTLSGQIASTLLYSGKSVQQVANEFHFSDQAQLTKFFKRHSGLTPTQYIARNS
ncbi:MAG: helix-turn-helix domain-containing protein [Muribaculaceae bacterium]